MNTHRINREIDLAMDKLIKKGIVDLPRTLERTENSDQLLLLIGGTSIEEKALNRLEKLKEIMLLDIPIFFTHQTLPKKNVQYRLNRDQFDDNIADYLMSFSVPTTENVDISIWEMKFYERP